MDRTLYKNKINEYFKEKGLNYKYKKNDQDIYFKLKQYGSLKNACQRAKKIHQIHKYADHTPSNSESCTTIYKFFEEIDNRLKELK